VLVQAGVRRVWVATSDRELVERATAAGGTSIPGQTWKEAARAVMETGGLSSSSPKAPERKPTVRVVSSMALAALLSLAAADAGLDFDASSGSGVGLGILEVGLPDSLELLPDSRASVMGGVVQARSEVHHNNNKNNYYNYDYNYDYDYDYDYDYNYDYNHNIILIK
jgi:hypothetical protein